MFFTEIPLSISCPILPALYIPPLMYDTRKKIVNF